MYENTTSALLTWCALSLYTSTDRQYNIEEQSGVSTMPVGCDKFPIGTGREQAVFCIEEAEHEHACCMLHWQLALATNLH